MNWSGLTTAAAAAPGLSLLALFLWALGAVSAQGPSSGFDDLGRFALGGGLILLVAVTVWGFVPAMMFGCLMLAVLKRSAWPRSLAGRALAGTTAAMTYVACGLAVASTVPSLAFLLAPWALLVREQGLASSVPLLVAIVASGAPAGLIYAAFERRG